MAALISDRAHWVVAPEVAAASFISGYRGSTRTNYGATLRKWLWFCEDTELDPWKVNRTHIEGWLHTMPPHAARHAATVVCGFYRDAHGNGLTRFDLSWGVRRPRVGRSRAGTYATREELGRMLRLARGVGGDTWALLAILILTGARVGETCNLTVEDVERDPIRLVFRRKHHHIDSLVVPAGVVEALNPLLNRRHTGWLLRAGGGRLSTQQARLIVTSIAEQAGCRQRITPHSLRRSFVTVARDLGVCDEDIMAMTGHVDASMIDFYDRGRRQCDGVAGVVMWEAITKM